MSNQADLRDVLAITCIGRGRDCTRRELLHDPAVAENHCLVVSIPRHKLCCFPETAFPVSKS